MKKTYLLAIALFALLQLSVSSCKKLENTEPKVETNTPVTSFKQIKVDPSFDWKSTSNITLNIAAANTPVAVTNTLIVKTESGVVIFKKLQKMNESFTGNIVVPSSLTKVVISYGSIVKTVDIMAKKIDFNFITETTIVE